MTGKPRIEIHQAKNKEYFLNIKAANNKKVLTSGETYKTLVGVENAAKSAKKIITGGVIINTIKPKKV